MSERWQRELEKLRTVGVPSSMRTRVDAGPTGEGVPPMPGRRQRVVAGIVAFLVFGGAIAFAWGAFGRSSSPVVGTTGQGTVTIELHGCRGPSASLHFGDQTSDPQVSSYCWSSGGSGMCADTVLRAFEPDEFVQIPVGTSVSVNADTEEVVLSVSPGNDPRANGLAIPLRGSFDHSGRLVLTVTATWPEGDVQFFFAVDVVQEETPSPESSVVATMTAPADGSVPELVLTYDGRTQDFFAQGGAWPGVDGWDQPLLSFASPVAPGSSLHVESDATTLDGRLRIVGNDGSPTDQEISLDLSSGSTQLPNEQGIYELVLKGTWQRGIAVFYVRIQIREPNVIEPSPSASASPSPTLPDLVGMTDQQAMVALNDLGLTWVVAFRAVDGEHWHVAETDPPAGSAIPSDLVVRLVVATEITPLPAGAEDALACPAVDHVAFGGPHVVTLPTGEAFVRGNTGGIEKTDEVVPSTSDGSSGLWHVIRDGAVIAVVDAGMLDGVACAGSGVGAA